MTVSEYNNSIATRNRIGLLCWNYNKKPIYVDVLEIASEVENDAGEKTYFLHYRALHQMPMVKVENGKVYFLTERSSSGEIDWPEFETRGLKCHLNLD